MFYLTIKLRVRVSAFDCWLWVGYRRIFLFELKYVMGFRNTGFTGFPSLRIQPPLIRFRY